MSKAAPGACVRGGDAKLVDDALSVVGHGRFHLELLLACGLGFSAVAVEVVTLAFILPELQAEWGATDKQLALLPMTAAVGQCVGGPFWGMVADRCGRRASFAVTVLFIAVFGLLAAFSTSLAMLTFLRLVLGFGVGGAVSVDFTLLSELSPTQARGDMLMLMSAFWPAGSCCGAAMAWCIIPSYGWRVFLGCSTVPSMLALFLRPWIPESPRWLLLQGRHEDAKGVLQGIAARNGMTPEEAGLGAGVELCLDETSSRRHSPLSSQRHARSLRKRLPPEDVTINVRHLSELESACAYVGQDGGAIAESWRSVRDIFSKNWWRTTAGVLAVGIGLSVTSYGLFTIMPTILMRKGVEKDGVYRTMLLTCIAQFPSVAVMFSFSRLVGRLALLKTSFLPVAASLLCFLAATDVTTMSICLMIGSFAQEGVWVLFHAYLTEVYPTEIRATAIGTVEGIHGVLSMGTPLATACCLTGGVGPAICFLATAAAAAGCVASFFLHIETDGSNLRDTVKLLGGSRSSSSASLGGAEAAQYGAASPGRPDAPVPAA